MKAKLSSLIVIVLLTSLLIANCAPAATEAPAPMPEETVAPAPMPEETEAPMAEETEAPKPPAPECIQLGSSMPQTGKYGALGAMIQPGYEIAVDDINAAGGVYVEEYGTQVPLCLTIYDDESDPTKAVARMETLNDELDLTAYLGGGGSEMHAATAGIAEKNQVPYCGIAFALEKIHQQGYKYLFSPFPKSTQQAGDVFEVLNSVVGDGEKPTIAIFSYNDDWGQEMTAIWEAQAAANGYEIAYKAENPPKPNDWTDNIIQAKAAGAEVLLTLPVPPDGPPMFQAMQEQDWAPKFVLAIRAPEALTWADTGAAGDYVTIFPGWHHEAKYEGVDELNAAFEAKYGRPADLLTGPGYACVQIIAAAIEAAGTLDTAAVRDAMAATDMDTVIGHVTFNENGTGNVPNPLVQWQQGEQHLVFPADQASTDIQYPAPPFAER